MARYNTFFIPHGDDGDAQKRLNDFLSSHRVCKVERAVFPEGWTFCVEWLPGDGPQGGGGRSAERVDYMKVLPPDEFRRFSALRDRRRSIAQEEKVSAYLVATDAQLAALAKVENPTVADLRGIDGFGDARIEKFGARLLGRDEAGGEPV